MKIQSAADLEKVLTQMTADAELMAQEIKRLREDGRASEATALARKLEQLEGAFKSSGIWRGATVSDESVEKRHENLGELLKAVAAKNSAKVQELGGKAGGFPTEEKATGTPLVDDSATGSYLVPVAYFREILRVAQGASELYPLVSKKPMTTRTGYFPKKLAGVSFSRVTSDAGSLTEANPTFTQVSIAVETWALWIAVTEALMEDEASSLGAYFEAIIREAWVSMFEGNFLNHAANPTGLLTAATSNVVTMGEGDSTFDSVKIDYLDEVIGKLTTKAKRRNARWFMHPTILDYLAGQKNDMGDYIVTAPAAGPARTIRGYPIVLSDEMPDSGDSAGETPFIAFGDPAEMIFAERLGLELKYYDQTLSAVQYAEAFFRARIRADWKLAHEDSFAVLKTAAG